MSIKQYIITVLVFLNFSCLKPFSGIHRDKAMRIFSLHCLRCKKQQ